MNAENPVTPFFWRMYLKLKRRLPYRLQPYLLAHRAFHAASGGRILGGPFGGMKYVSTGIESAYYAKVLGVYEHELHETVRSLATCGFDRVLDIGAAEGYYAAGLAYLDRAVDIVAYEGDSRGQRLLRRMIELNRLDGRIAQKGWCDTVSLKSDLADCENPLVIVDCEGGEYDLLVPDRVPELRKAVILVELHAWIRSGLPKALRDRFSATHYIRDIAARPRKASDFPRTGRWILDRLGPGAKAYLVREGRPNETPWMLISPKGAKRANQALGFAAPA